MRISRKTFLHLTAASATAALWPSAVDAGQAKSKKVEKAAIKGTTDALTSFITKTTLASIPADVVAQAKRCLVDGFGVILAGSTVKGSQIVRDYVRSTTDRKEATAIGQGSLMTTASHAALLNAASARGSSGAAAASLKKVLRVIFMWPLRPAKAGRYEHNVGSVRLQADGRNAKNSPTMFMYLVVSSSSG